MRKVWAAEVGGICRRPWGSPHGVAGFREPILAELGVKRSTTWLKYAVTAQTSMEGSLCASWRGPDRACPCIRHVRTDMAGLSSAGAHESIFNKAADARRSCIPNSHGREPNVGCAGSRGFPWVGPRRPARDLSLLWSAGPPVAQCDSAR